MIQSISNYTRDLTHLIFSPFSKILRKLFCAKKMESFTFTFVTFKMMSSDIFAEVIVFNVKSCNVKCQLRPSDSGRKPRSI